MNLLSIQSHVAYGHVGNSAAVFPLQRLGVEVWPVHTVQFSNHTGYGETRGSVFDARLIRDVVAGIEKRGVLEKCDGVLSGYIGGVDIGEAILDAVAKLKRANPGALYCCDPVIGNAERGVFVREGVAEFIRDKAVPTADIEKLKKDPRVSLAIANDYPQPLQIKGLSIAAQAVETTDPNERAHAREILLKRYPEYKIMPPPDPATVPLIRITPEVVSVLDYSKGFGHADLLRVSDDDLEDFIEARRHHWASFHAA